MNIFKVHRDSPRMYKFYDEAAEYYDDLHDDHVEAFNADCPLEEGIQIEIMLQNEANDILKLVIYDIVNILYYILILTM